MNENLSRHASSESPTKGRHKWNIIWFIVAAFVLLAGGVVIWRSVAGPTAPLAPATSESKAQFPTAIARPPTLPPTPPPIRLVVMHTNDTWGYLYPCG